MYQHLVADDGFIYTDGKGHYAENVATDNIKKWSLVSKNDEKYVTYLAKQEQRKAKMESRSNEER